MLHYTHRYVISKYFYIFLDKKFTPKSWTMEDTCTKLAHRRLKDFTISSEFRNFLLTISVIIVIVYFFSSKPAYYTEYEKREKVDIKKLFNACLDAVEKGGKEVR